MAYTKNKLILELVDELANDGETIIKAAYDRSTFTNRLYNLHDSYGSAVYVNNVLYKYTIRYVGAESTKGDWGTSGKDEKKLAVYHGKKASFPDRRGNRLQEGDVATLHGRGELERFFADYKPNKRGIQLVVVAAMFYASILESGKLGKKYMVISGATEIMRSLAKLYHADMYKLDIWRQLNVLGKGSFRVIGQSKLV